MSLSEHEKTQFERLTANFALDDPSVLKKMAKRDRATAMNYMALPRLSTLLLILTYTVIVVSLGGLVTHIAILFVAGVLAGFFMLWAYVSCLEREQAGKYNKTRKGE